MDRLISTWTVLRSEEQIGFWVAAKIVIDRYTRGLTVTLLAEPEYLEAAVDRIREEMDVAAQTLKAQPIIRPARGVTKL